MLDGVLHSCPKLLKLLSNDIFLSLIGHDKLLQNVKGGTFVVSIRLSGSVGLGGKMWILIFERCKGLLTNCSAL